MIVTGETPTAHQVIVRAVPNGGARNVGNIVRLLKYLDKQDAQEQGQQTNRSVEANQPKSVQDLKLDDQSIARLLRHLDRQDLTAEEREIKNLLEFIRLQQHGADGPVLEEEAVDQVMEVQEPEQGSPTSAENVESGAGGGMTLRSGRTTGKRLRTDNAAAEIPVASGRSVRRKVGGAPVADGRGFSSNPATQGMTLRSGRTTGPQVQPDAAPTENSGLSSHNTQSRNGGPPAADGANSSAPDMTLRSGRRVQPPGGSGVTNPGSSASGAPVPMDEGMELRSGRVVGKRPRAEAQDSEPDADERAQRRRRRSSSRAE